MVSASVEEPRGTRNADLASRVKGELPSQVKGDQGRFVYSDQVNHVMDKPPH